MAAISDFFWERMATLKKEKESPALVLCMALGVLFGYMLANGASCGNMLWCPRPGSPQPLTLGPSGGGGDVTSALPAQEGSRQQQQQKQQRLVLPAAGARPKWAYAFYVTAQGVSALGLAARSRQPFLHLARPRTSDALCFAAVPVCGAGKCAAPAGLAGCHAASGYRGDALTRPRHSARCVVATHTPPWLACLHSVEEGERWQPTGR